MSKCIGSNRLLDKRSMNYVEGKAFRFSKRTSLAMSSGSKFVEIVLSTPFKPGRGGGVEVECWLTDT